MSGDDEGWKAAWRPVIEAVGRDLDDHAEPRFGVDRVEAGAIRRYLEPLELDCALHYDREVAQAHGYADIVAPYTAMSSFGLGPMWIPGRPLFTSAERNAQPARSPVKATYPDYFPPYSAYFATDVELEFMRPARVGERVGRRGRRLVACEPKATRVGRGAFIKIESETVTEDGELLAKVRYGSYLYDPHPGAR